MEILQAQINHAEELASLANEAFPGYPFRYVFSKEGVETAIQNGEYRVVMTDDERLVGSAVLGLDDSPMSEVKRVMVHPDYRSNGVASKLTSHLCQVAKQNQKIPYAEVRGDQIAMQKAALGAGMTAISFEPGKHAVFEHDKLGPARETMTFMTSEKVVIDSLRTKLRNVPKSIRQRLAENMTKALNPSPKDQETSRYELISPQESAREVLNNLLNLNDGGNNLQLLNSDVAIWRDNGCEIIFILPDRSAFVSASNPRQIDNRILEESGIQVSTIYVGMHDFISNNELHQTEYQPTSVRLWNSVWQIGWQAHYNNFERCLHNINLDQTVLRQISKVIEVVGI